MHEEFARGLCSDHLNIYVSCSAEDYSALFEDSIFGVVVHSLAVLARKVKEVEP